MEKIDELLEQWKSTEDAYKEIIKTRDEIEKEIISIMSKNIWRTYITPSKIHASFLEEEESHVDTNQLSILLNKSDLDSVMRYSTRRKLIIMTPDGKTRLRNMLKV